MEENQIITYIKNGEEKTITLNIFNKSKIKKEIFESNNNDKRIIIKNDIEYIHFKNIDLPLLCNKVFSFTGIECTNPNTLCILENCFIENERKGYKKVFELIGGSYQLIDIDTEKLTVIKPSFCKDIIIDNYNLIPLDDRNIQIYNFEESEKIDLKDNEILEEIDIKCDEVSLSGKFLLDKFFVSSDNKLKIGKINEQTEINVTDLKCLNIILGSEQLELNNCIITCDYKGIIYIYYSDLKVNNFTIKTKGKIIINDKTVFNEKDKYGYVTITDKDLLRLELSTKLAKRLSQINYQIELDAEKYLPQHENQNLVANIEKQKKIIKQEELILQEMKNELIKQTKTRKNNIIKTLRKKK